MSYAQSLNIVSPQGYKLKQTEKERLNLILSNTKKEDNIDREDLTGYIVPIYSLDDDLLFNPKSKIMSQAVKEKGDAVMVIKDKQGPFLNVFLKSSDNGLIVQSYSKTDVGFEDAINLIKEKSYKNIKYVSLSDNSSLDLIIISDGKDEKCISIAMVNNREKLKVNINDAVVDSKKIYDIVRKNRINEIEKKLDKIKKFEEYRFGGEDLLSVEDIRGASNSKIKTVLIVAIILTVLILSILYIYRRFFYTKITGKRFERLRKKANYKEDIEE